jgi:DNA-binding CsgD family transcriptional regulator
MSIQTRQRDSISRTAYAASIGPAARAIVEAVAGSTTALQAVMNRSAQHPADPRAAFAALIAMRRAQAHVEIAVGRYIAWLIIGGVTRSAIARGLGIRPATVARLVGPAEHLASARGCDLVQAVDGTWDVHRLTSPEPATIDVEAAVSEAVGSYR